MAPICPQTRKSAESDTEGFEAVGCLRKNPDLESKIKVQSITLER